MQIHHEELSEITRYIDHYQDQRLEDKEDHFRTYMRAIEAYKPIDSETRILEVGTGTGWYPLLCAQKGFQCKGLEISPQLIEYALEWGRKYGLDPDIELGNVEEADIGDAEYDVVIASSVFEHIENWRLALKRIHQALRPGGALFFESTNKYSPMSGEFRLPLYGWLPDRARYWLRRKVHGEDVMKLGIDFNQFTYPQLRRQFREIGFTGIYDRIDMANPTHVSATWKGWAVRAAKSNSVIKAATLTFADVTRFVCIK